MPVKIRLQRHGKKGKPYFYIVAADGRTKRDGRYIERLGNYNPNTNPATIELDHDRAVDWMQKGAVPTDTARAILSYKGVLYHNHLLKGVAKGAFSEEEAEKRYQAWKEQKEGLIQAKIEKLAKNADKDREDRLKAEREINAAREKELAAADSELSEEVAEEAPAAEVTTEAPAEEAPAKEEKAEEAPAKEEKAEEAPAKEAKAEEKEEEPAKEEKADEPVADASDSEEEKADDDKKEA